MLPFLAQRNMKDKHSSLTKNSFFSVLRFFLLVILCISASVILVWPLWKFSLSFPKIYTITILTLAGIAAIFLIINKIRKSNIRSVIKFLVNLLIILFGSIFSIKLVLIEKKLIALGVFILSIALIVIFNYVMNRIRHE